MKTDVLVIGGGPGGHVAAIKAVEYGASAIVVEKYKLGGTCLHQGCIPTKTLLHTTDVYYELQHAAAIGLKVDNASVDIEALQRRKNEIINTITEGVNAIVSSKGVEVVYGTAELVSEKQASVVLNNGETILIDFDKLILATGSIPSSIPITGANLPNVITSDDALSLSQVPEALVVIGGGVIGVEFGQLMSRLGAKVSIIEACDNILPHMDAELSSQLAAELVEEGIDIYTSARVAQIEQSSGQLNVGFDIAGELKSIKAEKVLMAVGRKPLVHGFGLEHTRVQIENGAIAVNRYMQTNVPHIYAIGDCTGGYMLAHVAFKHAMIAAKNITGDILEPFNDLAVPACVYTSPEFATVGLTESAASKRFSHIKIGKADLAVNAKTMIVQQRGTVKFVVDTTTNRVLGLHILGPRASDMIHEAALALNLNATIDDIVDTIHGHPTIAEGILEAAEDVFGNAIYKMYNH
ncbi:dihydrolipoamide dehydrogenase [Shewanella mangrovi]|uniref:Dihydrolipoyl dehydrogenase n=1 Tax=Shewanella mangrovi TaxID=1515746 RepID=A0A094K1Z7_9GAMM|nr:dihydrolipoyl dehydrogenase [Shewanella mangrovi]KFZ38696.1 dihydrolipoamide dehydrogenase [Shewanella mangrovi]